ADIDADGDDIADDEMSLEMLGINLEERSKLAELYLAGQSLWRVPISHFTEPYDCNWGPRYPDDADDPPDDPDPPPPPPGPCNKSNASSIECETQVLRETLAVAGTDLTLNYASDRVPGRVDYRSVSIPLSGSSVPASLERIDVELQIGGQVLRHS